MLYIIFTRECCCCCCSCFVFFFFEGRRWGKVLSRYVKQGRNEEKLWEHGNIWQFWKGTQEQAPPPPWETLFCDAISLLLASVTTVLGSLTGKACGCLGGAVSGSRQLKKTFRFGNMYLSQNAYSYSMRSM